MSVAKGRIVQPAQNMMHNVQIRGDMVRVELTKVFSGYEDMDPTELLEREEGAMKLVQCMGWYLRWSKHHITLAGSSLRGTPLPSAMHTHVPTPRPSPLGLCKHVESKDVVADDEGAEHVTDDDKHLGLPLADEPQEDIIHDLGDLGMPDHKQSIFQDTPPAADPEEQPTKTVKLTPNTLFQMAKDVLVAAPAHSMQWQTKRRKRSKKQHITGTNEKLHEKIQAKKSFGYEESRQ